MKLLWEILTIGVVKLDISGSVQWQNSIGGDSADVLNSLSLTGDGGYILGGTSYSLTSSDKSETSRGFNDYWLVKLDSIGQKQWDKTIGGNLYDNCKSIQ